MADYARRSPSKRFRRDFEELAPSRASYGSSRSGLADLSGGYDDRSAGLGLRNLVQVPYLSNVGYNPAIFGATLTGAGGVGTLGGAGSWGLDDQALSARLAAYATGVGGMSQSYNLNGSDLKPESARTAASFLSEDRTSTLFVDGLPADCSRREAAHIFRPFIGFKEVRVVHKEGKRGDGEKMVLCFVEFNDAGCAATALESLKGYKLDEKDPDSELRVTFAKYSGPRGGGRRNLSPARGRDRSPYRGRDRRR